VPSILERVILHGFLEGWACPVTCLYLWWSHLLELPVADLGSTGEESLATKQEEAPLEILT